MFHVERKGERVSVLRIDDGKVNAIGPEFVERFPTAWAEATADARAVVIAGNAKALSAGLNLKVLPTLERAELVRFASGFMSMFGEILGHPRPVVAAVDGPALAGGAIIALCADFRFVGPRAKLGLTEVPIGIPFPKPVADLARAKLPPQEWPEALLRGAIREGEACVGHGWAQSYHAEGVEAAAVARADELAQFYAGAYGPAKRVLNGDLATTLSAFAKDGAEAWVDDLTSEATMAALLEGFARMTARK